MSEQQSKRTFDAGDLYAGLLDRLSPSPDTAPAAAHSLLAFAVALYPGYQIGRHHVAIAEALERVERGETKRLMISMPPRHGKSLLASTLFPAWYLGRNNDGRIIACSYGAALAYDFSRDVRNTVASEDYREIFPSVRLADDAQSVGAWKLAHPMRGGYVAAGVGGAITGKGSNILLIDDPVRSEKDAASETILESIWRWYGSTAYTRIQGDGAVILIMTRWSENDLAGRLLHQMEHDPDADQWEVLRLPAFAEENDPLGREINEPLWPEMYGTDILNQRRKAAGERGFAAIYQQRPSPAGGNIFKREWWRRYGAFDRSQAQQVIQVWDTAFKAKSTNDYSVCTTWALTSTGAYLLDMFRDRVEFPELKRTAADVYAKWQPNLVLIEDKASGQSLIQELRRETRIPILPIPTDSDKVARAVAATPPIEAGRVFIPEDAPWVSEFIEEHSAFPNGAHDDIVDTTGMAIKRLFGFEAGVYIRSAEPEPQSLTSTFNQRLKKRR